MPKEFLNESDSLVQVFRLPRRIVEKNLTQLKKRKMVKDEGRMIFITNPVSANVQMLQ